MLVYAGIGGAADLSWLNLYWRLPYVPAPSVLCVMSAACVAAAFSAISSRAVFSGLSSISPSLYLAPNERRESPITEDNEYGGMFGVKRHAF